MNMRNKIRKQHKINTYKQECKNMLQAMREMSDGVMIWHVRNKYMLLKAEIEKLEERTK